ncbi:hypothetical protein [Nocardioides marmotae]|uniref:hypothetical protein n=1 Tax=Nocardioides marmotae TaxID=2663857 RepID=UPI0012B554EB|nr:hypothetical protein [Nocardioides marmotae]MBC9734901.1 hypothetical protein [Nocardioides marmotae]MTB86001.1 hypothetical protein [Nocardioides marmotae]
MEEWWRLNQGYFVMAAFLALVLIGWRVRRWRRKFVARAADNSARGATWDNQGNPFVEKLLVSLATEVHLDTDLPGAEQVLAATKLPRWWKPAGERAWTIQEGEVATTAVLVPAEGGGTRLALREAVHQNGMPTSEGNWRKLRRAVLTAAEAAGVGAAEEAGPRLLREPDRWVRGPVGAG